MSGFYQALPIILRSEGGFVDDPLDRGGATNHGVTQATYGDWLGRQGLPPKDVRDITKQEVEAIYHERYWVASKCDAMPWPVSLLHFDAAVNHGSVNAWKIMQRALGVASDGRPGPATMGALDSANTDDLIWKWLTARTEFYVGIVKARPSQVKFLKGWLIQRVINLHREAREAA